MSQLLMTGDIQRLNTLSTAASGDFVPVVDVSDNNGTLKKITRDNLVDGASVASATITTATITTGNITTIGGTAVRTPSALTGTTAITAALHANRINIITGSALATYTLPEATGTGNRYLFIIAELNTNNNVFVTADTTNAGLYGSVNILDVDAAAQQAFFTVTAGTSDTVTLNATTTGGQIGDIIEFIDIATDKWSVWGQLRCPAGSNVATCFSAAV